MLQLQESSNEGLDDTRSVLHDVDTRYSSGHTKIVIDTTKMDRSDGVFKFIVLQTMMTRIIISTPYKTFQNMYISLVSPVG
jgi:hypothetical protein